MPLRTGMEVALGAAASVNGTNAVNGGGTNVVDVVLVVVLVDAAVLVVEVVDTLVDVVVLVDAAMLVVVVLAPDVVDVVVSPPSFLPPPQLTSIAANTKTITQLNNIVATVKESENILFLPI
jgi:hypothetical protein